jgi:hypothetical protein
MVNFVDLVGLIGKVKVSQLYAVDALLMPGMSARRKKVVSSMNRLQHGRTIDCDLIALSNSLVGQGSANLAISDTGDSGVRKR